MNFRMIVAGDKVAEVIYLYKGEQRVSDDIEVREYLLKKFMMTKFTSMMLYCNLLYIQEYYSQ